MKELFKEFSEFRRILCLCPCCGEIVRVSDLHIYAKKPIINTWLDNFEDKNYKFGTKENKFEEQEADLRRKAQERGRKQSQEILNKFFNDHMTPAFIKLKLDPVDIKPVFNPIDFLVFNGMNTKETVDNIMLLSKETSNEQLNCLRNQIKTIIEKKQYDWQVTRISQEGAVEYE